MKTMIPMHQRYPSIAVEGGVVRHYSSDHVLRYGGERFGVCMIPASTATESVMRNNGPDAPRTVSEYPTASTYGLGWCIDNHGGTGAEMARKLADGSEHIVDDGDVVWLVTPEGTIPFTVGPLVEGRRVRHEYLSLVLVLATSEATAEVTA